MNSMNMVCPRIYFVKEYPNDKNNIVKKGRVFMLFTNYHSLTLLCINTLLETEWVQCVFYVIIASLNKL